MPVSLFNRKGGIKDTVARRLRSCQRTVLLLDFDGTLAPIRRTPSAAGLSAGTKHLLRRLASRRPITLCLVTGRSLHDIVKKLGIHGVILLTNHGFQISSGAANWVHPAAKRVEPLLVGLGRKLGRALEGVSGVLVESKKLTLSVHYRNVPKKNVRKVKGLVQSIVYPHRSDLLLTAGKKVVEIRPRVEWGKGHAVLRVLRSIRHEKTRCVVYIGDDTTDEAAFRMLPAPAVTIRVGKGGLSAAAYRVQAPSEVFRFLGIVESIYKRDTKE
jgi:trehalose 6-phosphate phosphatase